ncbi:MAG: DUF3293 domain-containing protein [Bacteroidota bacterium]
MDDISGNLDQHLLEAYLATTYEVQHLGLKIKIGVANWSLEEFLVDNNVFTWAFISAYNPRSRPLSFEENEKRHARLVSDVKGSKLAFSEGFDVPDQDDWEAEKSLLILDISKKDSVALGKKFEQNAIVFGRLGGSPELVVLS